MAAESSGFWEGGAVESREQAVERGIDGSTPAANGAEGSDFDDLLKMAQSGETLVDPRCGKYEAAVLTGVQVVSTENSLRLDLRWGGMQDVDGNGFDHIQRIFMPDTESHAISKIRYMNTLKGLGVVPQSYKNMLYFTDETIERLRDKLESTCVGQEFPLTISMDNRGFYNTTIRTRRRQAS